MVNKMVKKSRRLVLLSEFHDGAQLFSCQVFDTTSEASGINLLCNGLNYSIIFILHIHGFIKIIMGSIFKDISKDQRDNIFF